MALTGEKNIPSPCPALTKELATDLNRYLFAYYDTMPIQAFTDHLLILINFELFQLHAEISQCCE